MRTKKTVALLLCFVMLLGAFPMYATAEEATAISESAETTFNLLIDFDEMETTTTANATSFAGLVAGSDYFTATVYKGPSGLCYVERDSSGNMALKTTGNCGITINDTKSILAKESFVFEYDVRFETVAAGYNTVQHAFKDSSNTTIKTGLMPINVSKVTGTDGKKYPATYHMNNNQNIGATTRPTGVTGDLIVYPDQWYHYAFYVNSDTNKITAYRDGSLIWSSTLTSFPDDMKNSQLYLHSGAESSVTHYDNIHIQSLNTVDAKAVLDFEDVAFDKGVTSVNATTTMLNFMAGGRINFPYVHASATTVETDGNNKYIVGQSIGSHLGQGAKSSFFQLGDLAGNLSKEAWTIAFDMCIPGTSNGTTDYAYTSYEVSFFGLVANGTYNHILTLKQNGTLGRAAAGNYTSFSLVQGDWYRIFARYDPDAQKISLTLAGETEGYVNLGTYDFKPEKNTADTFFRFGYNYNANQYCKFYFDNIAITTADGVDINLDFEEGKANDGITLSDYALEGADTFVMLNGGNYLKEPNNNFKYLDDEDGNTFLGSFVGHNPTYMNIYDQSLKTLSKKFVISFDFKINQKTTTYTMATWRTSNKNIPLWILAGNTLKIRPKLDGSSYEYTSSSLTRGKWYNLSVIIDPVTKQADFYIGGLDTKPVYSTVYEHNLDGATYSSLSIGPGSSVFEDGTTDYIGFDNIRIFTVEETVEIPENINTSTLPADGTIINTDFESFANGTALTSEAWSAVAPFGVTTNGGTVVESNGNKHYQPSTSGSGAASFNISSLNASPYTENVIAVETDFAFGNNSSNTGSLVIAALTRKNADGKTVNVPLLTANAAGKLTVAAHGLNYTLPNETVRIRIELSYAFHTVNVYVNGNAIATGIPLNVNTAMELAKLTFVDAKGINRELPFTGYAYEKVYDSYGCVAKEADGTPITKLHYYENYMCAVAAPYIKDSIDMFGATKSENWSFAVDNLKIYKDRDADVYFNGFDGWTTNLSGTTTPSQSLAVGNPFAFVGSKYISDNGNTVFSTLSETSSSKNGAIHIQDTTGFFDGKDFVLEFKVKFNPDYVDSSLSNSSGTAIFTDLDWHHMLRVYKDGRFGINSETNTHGKFRSNEWSQVQALFVAGASGANHTVHIYVDGIKVGSTASSSLTKTIRIGCQSGNYDLRLDDVRIYLSNTPDAYNSPLSGTLDGNKLLELEIADSETLEKVMGNQKDGVVWGFKDFSSTAANTNGASVNVLLNKGDYVRVVHRYLTDLSSYNISIPKAALEGYEQYVIETEIRYTCPTGFELEVASLFNPETQTEDRLVYVPGTTREIRFNRNGFAYSLTDKNGDLLYVNDVTEDATEFTKIALIVDEAAGKYSIYVDGKVAYYNYGGETVSATDIEIDNYTIYSPNNIPSQTTATLMLNNIIASKASDALLDIKSLNVYVLRNGVAPKVEATQAKIDAKTFDVRFIAPIDSLYGSEVGFDITTKTKEITGGEATRSSNLVYSSIKAIDPETKEERDFNAEEFNGTYLVVITVNSADLLGGDIEFTVKPFVMIGDSKIYNETFTVIYNEGVVVTK